MNFRQFKWGLGALFVAFILFLTISCNGDMDMDQPDYSKGDTIWMHEMQGRDSFLTQPFIAIDESRRQLYYAKAGGTIYWTPARIVAISLDDGRMLWESPSLGNITIASEIVIGDDGTVYAISGTKLFAFDPSSGQEKWKWEVPEQVPNPDGPGEVYSYGNAGHLTLATNGSLILATGITGGSYYRALYNVSTSGTTNWINVNAVHLNGIQGDNIVVDQNNRCFYFTDQNVNNVQGKYLMAVDCQNGTVLWRTQIHAVGTSTNNIIFDNQGNLVISVPLNNGEPYRMHTINPDNGNILRSSSDEAYSSTKIIDGNGRIFQRSNSIIYTYDQSTLQRSEFPGLNAYLTGSLLTNENKLMLIYGRNFQVHNTDGSLDWDVPYDGMDDRLFALSSDGIVYAIVTSKGIVAIQAESQLSNSNWPKRTHDNRNTHNLSK